MDGIRRVRRVRRARRADGSDTSCRCGGQSDGGGGTSKPPAGAPAVTFSPMSLTFAAHAIATTSAPQWAGLPVARGPRSCGALVSSLAVSSLDLRGRAGDELADPLRLGDECVGGRR